MGRPTKLNDEMIAKAEAYIEGYAALGDMIPSVAGLAVELNVGRSTIYDWAKQDGTRLPDILKRLLAKQERVLFNNGLNGEFNSAITKLALGKHGYSDKQEVSGHDGGPVEQKWTVEFVNATDAEPEG